MPESLIARDERPSQRDALRRLCNPNTVAFVGVTDSSPYAAAARRTLEGDVDVAFVHPRADSVLGGRPVFRSIAEIDRPIDTVFSTVSAARTIDVLRQAAEVGAAGLVTIAGGFAEQGAEGEALQQEMASFAHRHGLSVVGPNGIGLLNVPRQLNLAMLSSFERRSGGLSAVTHSGAMLGALASAAWRSGGVGLNLLISAGNEAVTDVADYLDYLVEDDRTRVIALAIEKIRRPEAFFDAASRCLVAGKPIVAIKMGRSARGSRMAASHTGTLTSDAWVYEVAFKQAGIQTARELDELVDMVQFLEQLPRQKWTDVRGLAVVTGTGGFAQLASDIGEDLGLDIPEAAELQPWVKENIPGGLVPNPLDATGFVATTDGLWRAVLDTYARHDAFDTLIYLGQLADWDVPGYPSPAEPSYPFLAEQFRQASAEHDKPFLISPLGGHGGRWLDDFRRAGLAVGNGLAGSFKAIQTMARFMRTPADSRVNDPGQSAPVPRPAAPSIVVPEGLMLPFADTMLLLEESGIPVAPYEVAGEGVDAVVPGFEGPYVVKLADVAHRTEHGAVCVGVSAEDIPAAIRRLRAIADAHGLPRTVAVQAMVHGHGEAFVGIQGQSELGPLVVFGLGGVFVEILKKVGARLAPFDQAAAAGLIDEFSSTGIIDGFRGSAAWDRKALGELLVAAGQLAAGGRGWIASIDINPLIVTDEGLVAVDGLCLLRD